MTKVDSLERRGEEMLEWNKASINFIAQFIVVLIQMRAVNFSEIANAITGKVQPSSNYKRIQFFQQL